MYHAMFRALVMLGIAASASADQVVLPHSFSSNTRAVASEINENFSALTTETNNQDRRITALEAASFVSISNQLVCRGNEASPVFGEALTCLLTSDPTAISSPTFADVVADGWVLTTVGGSVVFVFSK